MFLAMSFEETAAGFVVMSRSPDIDEVPHVLVLICLESLPCPRLVLDEIALWIWDVDVTEAQAPELWFLDIFSDLFIVSRPDLVTLDHCASGVPPSPALF